MVYISERSYVNEQYEHEQHDHERHPRRDRHDCEYLTIGHGYLHRLDRQVFCACVGNKCLPSRDFSEIQHYSVLSKSIAYQPSRTLGRVGE
jgi:hypothetical protein